MEDLDEWEVLPEDGLLEIHDDHQGNKIFSRKYTSSSPSDSVFKNYFGYSSSPPVPIQLPPPPPQLILIDDVKEEETVVEDAADTEQDLLSQQQVFFKKETEFVDMKLDSPRNRGIVKPPLLLIDDVKEEEIVVEDAAETEQDLLSQQQVFFKKETEFVDMKLDSPRSRGIVKPPPQMVQFEEAPPEAVKISDADAEKERNSDGVMNRNNILKWSLTGIGAICSFGVATVCVLVLGGLVRNPNSSAEKQQRGQKLQFHIYAEDKRLKQVVHQANKLNEAMAAMRGAPFTTAHITFGGYCDSH